MGAMEGNLDYEEMRKQRDDISRMAEDYLSVHAPTMDYVLVLILRDEEGLKTVTTSSEIDPEAVGGLLVEVGQGLIDGKGDVYWTEKGTTQ